MSTADGIARVVLVDVPESLMRPDLERRLPVGGRFADLTGKQYEPCTVIGFAGWLKQYSVWLCRCKCDELFIARANGLEQSSGQSCGCASKEAVTTHGLSKTPEYQVHKGMIGRCYYEGTREFKRYGGRGIRVCDRWRNSFEAFYADMGPRPEGGGSRLTDYSIDRRNNDGHYSCGKCDECNRKGWPANCRWATMYEQLANKSSHNIRMYTLNEATKPMTAWAEDIGVTRERMRQRINKCEEHGVDIAEALTTPSGETMPSFKDSYLRYKLRIAKRNASMVKDEWFDGKVHVIRQGKHWSQKIACETFRNILAAEGESRGGKCKFRILKDHIMFVYESKESAAA